MWTNTINCITGYTVLGSLNKGYFVTKLKTQQIRSRECDGKGGVWRGEGMGRNVIKMQVFMTGFSFIS